MPLLAVVNLSKACYNRMLDFVEKHLFFIIVAAFSLPMTFNTFIFPILKLKKARSTSGKRTPRFVALVAAAGFAIGWFCLPFVNENYLLAFVVCLLLPSILIGLYLLTKDDAARFSISFFERTRISPERWIDTIDAPVALPALVLFASTIAGTSIHIIRIT